MATKVVCDRCGSTVQPERSCPEFLTLKHRMGSGFFVEKQDLCESCLHQIARACEPQPRAAEFPPGAR